MYKYHRVVCVIPALNEELSIALVVTKLLAIKDAEDQAIIDHIVVCDNGSTDNTAAEAQAAGAELVCEPIAGYGRACLAAIDVVTDCDFLLFVDGDDSCYPTQALKLLEALESDADLCVGSRVLGCIEVGALTPAQRFGNWLASVLIGSIWKQKITDLGPFRAIRWSVLQQLNMQDQTFGWTVEMQIKAIQHGLRVEEVAVDSKVRIGQSKISGTVRGTILAGVGILSKIASLWWRGYKNPAVSIKAK